VLGFGEDAGVLGLDVFGGADLPDGFDAGIGVTDATGHNILPTAQTFSLLVRLSNPPYSS
jgi:hypothetical protein